jgi:NADP-dependent 3-hydroxy acid dehydrogenase YdfG
MKSVETKRERAQEEFARGRTAVVTGASAGIGAATARALAAAGFSVVLGARRTDRVEALAAEISALPDSRGAVALHLDVADAASVEAFAARVPELHLLVNNAGAAFGVAKVEEATDADWAGMWEINVLGVLRTTRAFLPKLLASGDGQVVNLGSIAGFETYSGGGGYTGTKHALRALSRTLRLELLGRPVRVTEIDPGLVESEFSMIRYAGDAERAKAVYQGLTPLTPADVADAVVWAATRPAHVNIDEIVLRPRDQATAWAVHRRPTS